MVLRDVPNRASSTDLSALRRIVQALYEDEIHFGSMVAGLLETARVGPQTAKLLEMSVLAAGQARRLVHVAQMAGFGVKPPIGRMRDPSTISEPELGGQILLQISRYESGLSLALGVGQRSGAILLRESLNEKQRTLDLLKAKLGVGEAFLFL